MTSLYTETSVIGRLLTIFSALFPSASKLQLAADLLDEVMPMLSKRQVVLLFDSWYVKKNLIQHARQYGILAIICNVRHDTQIYELPTAKTGPGRPRNPQELRHFLSWQIQREIIFAVLAQKAQNSKNPEALLKALQE